uniref:Battenin n=1 Tax=Paramoeba aestuarina TaxID=180227 RepID=A0A7S4NN67_9EUKA|mmetsp:Transcript_21445/g.33320  ORF Transcript_21445/g.33320 Transcript_21445/m.33320 type:complete len:457 (+) Transcript_21445:28-1398(+)
MDLGHLVSGGEISNEEDSHGHSDRYFEVYTSSGSRKSESLFLEKDDDADGHPYSGWEEEEEEEYGEEEALVGIRFTQKDIAIGQLCFFFVGFTPFILQNAFLAEVAFWVNHTPEGRAIGTSITTAFVLGNLCSLFAMIIPMKMPSLSDRHLLVALDLAALLICFLIAVFWDADFDTNTSWVIIILSFLAGGVGNVSTLTLFSFVASYTHQMTYASNLGAGFSGLFAGLFAILQRPSDPNYYPFWFFLIIAELILMGLIAFMLGAWSETGSNLRIYIVEENMMINDQTTRFPKLDLDTFKAGALPLFYMFWMMCVAYLIPPLVPYLSRHDTPDMIAYLYTLYLLGAPLGSAASSAIGHHFYKTIWVSGILQTFFAIYLLVSCLNAVDLGLPYWLCYLGTFFTAFIMGFNTTSIYLYIRSKYKDHLASLSFMAVIVGQVCCVVLLLTSYLIIVAFLYY